MKSLLKIMILFGLSWYFSDIGSASLLTSVIAPAGVVISLIAFLVWVVLFFNRKGISQTTSRGGVDGFDGFGDGGGDC